ncbi:hypothetical protein XENORESO_002912 [Xenotaenia resolanae]|uniref:Uncharacterized protein n=1 Tax=Xenotaenia resolanae TaxID=208358 RepID=A0ABV0WNX8_9TELE
MSQSILDYNNWCVAVLLQTGLKVFLCLYALPFYHLLLIPSFFFFFSSPVFLKSFVWPFSLYPAHVSKTNTNWKVSLPSSHQTFFVLHRALHIFSSNVSQLPVLCVCMFLLKTEETKCSYNAF